MIQNIDYSIKSRNLNLFEILEYTGCSGIRYIFFYHRYPYQNYTLCENIGKAIRFNKGVRAILSFLKKKSFVYEKLICSPIFMKIGIKLAAGILYLKKIQSRKNITEKKL